MQHMARDKKNRKVPVNIALDPETFNAYQRIAEEEQRPLSNALRIALQDQLEVRRQVESREQECRQLTQ